MTTPDTTPPPQVPLDHVLTLIEDKREAVKLGGVDVLLRLFANHYGPAAVPEEPTPQQYPHESGDVTVIGPECFTDNKGTICYQGENYYTDDRKFTLDAAASAVPPAPQTTACEMCSGTGRLRWPMPKSLKIEVEDYEDSGSPEPEPPTTLLGDPDYRAPVPAVIPLDEVLTIMRDVWREGGNGDFVVYADIADALVAKYGRTE